MKRYPLLLMAGLLTLAMAVRAAVPLRDALAQQGFTPDICTLVEFEGTLNPALANAPYSLTGSIARNSPAYLPDGIPVAANTPRYVPGHAGQGVLIEPGNTNYFSAAASGAFSSLGEFTALGGATLTTTTVNALGGDNCLQVTTPGTMIGEGFSVTATSAALAANSSVTGSVWLRGSGTVSLQLYDMTNYTPSAPLFVTLTPEWQRYLIPPIKLYGASATSFKLRVTTAVAAATTFAADNLQIENRDFASSWTAGGVTRASEVVSYPMSQPTWALPSGTILLWVSPQWYEWTPLPSSDNRPFLYTAPAKPHLYLDSYNRLGVAPYTGWPAATGGGNMFAGGWHFVAVSWSPSGIVVCHNDKTASTTTVTSMSSVAQFLLGAKDSNNVAQAVYDDWAVLQRALTATELVALYNATK